jgi:hypothetical protein
MARTASHGRSVGCGRRRQKLGALVHLAKLDQ